MKNMKNFSTTTRNLIKELTDLAILRKAVLTFSEDATCINAKLPNGSFICTSCENALDENLIEVISFIKGCRIGSVRPIKRPSISNLGQIASRLLKLTTQYDIACEMDAMIDCGEFSGPALDRTYESEVEELLACFGLTCRQYNDELSSRITMNYTRFHTLRA